MQVSKLDSSSLLVDSTRGDRCMGHTFCMLAMRILGCIFFESLASAGQTCCSVPMQRVVLRMWEQEWMWKRRADPDLRVASPSPQSAPDHSTLMFTNPTPNPQKDRTRKSDPLRATTGDLKADPWYFLRGKLSQSVWPNTEEMYHVICAYSYTIKCVCVCMRACVRACVQV